jgi:hypothetical protein
MRETWFPIQSDEVREICQHLTASELSQFRRRGALYGLWCGATFAGPLGISVAVSIFYGLAGPDFFGLGGPVPFPKSIILGAVVLMLIHLACIRRWQNLQRKFLASTTWARQQGIDPVSLRLFSLRAGRK